MVWAVVSPMAASRSTIKTVVLALARIVLALPRTTSVYFTTAVHSLIQTTLFQSQIKSPLSAEFCIPVTNTGERSAALDCSASLIKTKQSVRSYE